MLWPTICSFCKEVEPEEASEYCSASCRAKTARTHDPAFGKAFTSGVLAAVSQSGPYMFSATSEVGKATLECFPTKDSHKAGSKKPERHCQWNDGWDIRTQVRFNGEALSFLALKQKIDGDSHLEAQKKMDELKDRLKAVAVQAVQAAKVAAVASLMEGSCAGEAARAAGIATVAALSETSTAVQMEETDQQSTIADEQEQEKKKRKTDNVESHGGFMEEPFTEDWLQRRKTEAMETKGPETKVKAMKSADKVEAPKAKNIDNVEVGSWVTVQAASRRTVDRAKADAPCLVTLIDSSSAHVLYPNLLSVFLSDKTDNEVGIKFRTEKCDLQSIRAYTADISTLDRKMVINLCQAVSRAPTPSRASNAAASSFQAEASTHETPVKLSKHATRGHDWLRQFTARVAQAFKAAGREAMDKTALSTALTRHYAASEVSEGVATLEALNKVIISDDAIFLAC